MTKIATNGAGIRGIGPQADFFMLGGLQSPGLATLVSCNAAQEWDIRKGFGLMWATLVPSGEALSKIDFEVDIWTGPDSVLFDAFAAAVLSRPVPAQPGTTIPKALGFAHDQASAPPYNVSAVVVLDVVYLGQREPGKVSHRISLLEWRAPVPAPKRPAQNTPATDGKRPTATTAVQRELLSAVDDQAALGNQLRALQ